MAKEWYEIGSGAQKTVAGITDPAGIFTGLKAAEDADDQAKKAQEALDSMGQKPKFAANPALLSYYSRNLNASNNPVGYTAAEKAQFKNNINTTLSTQQNNAVRTSGGQFSRYIASALTPGTVNANNEFAVNDARLRQQNQNTSMGRLYSAILQLQNIDNQNTNNAYNYSVNKEQALANSILQQKRYAQDQRDQTGQRVANGIGMVYTLGASGAFNKKGTASPDMTANPNPYDGIDNTNISGNGYQYQIQPTPEQVQQQNNMYGYNPDAPYKSPYTAPYRIR